MAAEKGEKTAEEGEMGVKAAEEEMGVKAAEGKGEKDATTADAEKGATAEGEAPGRLPESTARKLSTSAEPGARCPSAYAVIPPVHVTR